MSTCSGIDEVEWSEFLSRTPSTTPFQSPEMMRVYSEARGYTPHVLFVESHGQIEGVLSSVLITYGPGGFTRLTTHCITHGGPVGNPATFEGLLKDLDSFASKRALLSEIRNFDPPSDRTHFLGAGYTWEDHLDFEIDLKEGEAAVWNAMSKSRRKGISKAEQAGLETVELRPSFIASAYSLLEETYRRAKVPLADVSLFESAMRVLGTSGRLWLVGAVCDGALCAVRFVLNWNQTLFDWYAGSSDVGRNLHADEWLVWQTLKRGTERGYRTFRFGGAGRPGEEYGPGEFKRRFGGHCLNPGRFVKVYRPKAASVAHTMYMVRRKLS